MGDSPPQTPIEIPEKRPHQAVYVNAIDYLRGHKLSLVWFGMNIADIRGLRATNVGTECGLDDPRFDWIVEAMVMHPERLTNRFRKVIRQYAKDLDMMLREVARVTKDGGSITFVVGDCELRGVDVLNSEGVRVVAKRLGLRCTSRYSREIKQDRRYLPPPPTSGGGASITKRMWNEVVLGYRAQ